MAERGGDFAGDVAECAERYRHGIQRIPLALQEVEVPIIAAVNGPAIGAGFDLANMADIRIASEKARFGETFLNLGIIPGDGGAWFMQRLIGYQQAFELTLSGRIIDAAEAKSLGVVLEVVAPEHLMVRATELASRFAAQPPKALRLTKRLMKMAQRMELKISLDLCATFQGMCHNEPGASRGGAAHAAETIAGPSASEGLSRVSIAGAFHAHAPLLHAALLFLVPAFGAGSSQRHRGRGHRTS